LIGETTVSVTRRALVEFIFPPVCAGCRRVGAIFCDSCRADIQWVSDPICRLCGNPHVNDRLVDGICDHCRLQPPPLARIRAATLYVAPIPHAIWQLKYEGAFALAEPLGELMAEAWPKWQMPVDVVVPVALHAKRERKRGYNQSTLLARHLSRKMGWRLVTNGLHRIRYTPPQTGLGRSERLQNVRQAFWAEPDQVAGRHVMLVDDVVTSGGTLAASAEALLAAGAISVSAYCLARATEKTHRAAV